MPSLNWICIFRIGLRVFLAATALLIAALTPTMAQGQCPCFSFEEIRQTCAGMKMKISVQDENKMNGIHKELHRNAELECRTSLGVVQRRYYLKDISLAGEFFYANCEKKLPCTASNTMGGACRNERGFYSYVEKTTSLYYSQMRDCKKALDKAWTAPTK